MSSELSANIIFYSMNHKFYCGRRTQLEFIKLEKVKTSIPNRNFVIMQLHLDQNGIVIAHLIKWDNNFRKHKENLEQENGKNNWETTTINFPNEEVVPLFEVIFKDNETNSAIESLGRNIAKINLLFDA